MNEIIERNNQLPDTLEDLTQFVLVGKAKLQAYMLKLQTVNKLSVAQEIRDQTLKETQEISNALIAAEQRIGELLLAIPKQSGMRTDLETSSEHSDEVKTKRQTIEEMGYNRQDANDYEQMARHPEVVQKVIDDALANGDVVTKASVMREIKHYKDRVKAQQEEIDALRNQEPQVVEKEIEVVPADYEKLKKKAKEASAYQADFNKERQKVADEKRKNLELQEQLKKLKEQTVLEQNNQDMKASAIMFAMQCRNFIESVGGYVFISEHLMEIPEKEREGYVMSAQAVHDWAQVLLNNIERSTNGISRISSES